MDKRLDTPTDLSKQGVEAVTEALSRLTADSFALYTKYKNFHWHLSGHRFRSLHLLFDEHAAEIFGTIDILAERARRIGGTTIRSISHISELQTISDNNEEYVAPADMITELMNDNHQVIKAMRKTHKVADDADDIATASELEVMIDAAENRAWFLFELSQDVDMNERESGKN